MLNLLPVLSFFKTNQHVFMYVAIALFFVLVGWHTHRVIVEAEHSRSLKDAVEAREKEITRLQKEVQLQAEAARLIASERADLQIQFNDLSEQISYSYDKTPANNNAVIHPSRIKLLNEQRRAANEIGGKR